MSASQSLVLSWANLRGIRSRAVSSAVAVLGFAGVATMLVVLLSGREAIRAMYELAGRDTVAAVMSGTSTWEASSFIPPPLIPELERMPGIARTDAGPEISKELTSGGVARLGPKSKGRLGPTANARGVTPAALRMRRDFRIVRGRAFTVYNSAANANIALHFAPAPEIVIGAVGYVLLLGLVSSILPCIRALRGPIPAGLFAR